MKRMARLLRMFLLAGLVALLAGCHVGVDIDVRMTEDGAGTVTITVIADKAIVDRAPGLAGDLRLDDVRAAGWTVDGPSATPDGGLQIVLTQPFSTPEQANAILASVNAAGGPLMGITFARTRGDDATTFTLNGTLQITGGLDAFSDADLLAVVGATPYANQLAAASIAPNDAATVTFRASLPGDVQSTTAPAGGPLTWVAPADGSAVDVATTTIDEDPTNVWAGPASKAALIALVVWCVVSVGFITYVIIVRRRRAAVRALR